MPSKGKSLEFFVRNWLIPFSIRYEGLVRIVPLSEEDYNKCKPSQKLRFAGVKELKDYDYVVLLDDDTLIVQDPSWDIMGTDPDAFKGLPLLHDETDAHSQPLVGLRGIMKMNLIPLFQEHKLPMPLHNSAMGWWDPYPYLNAGVLIFPHDIFMRLVPVWAEYTKKVLIAKGKYEDIRLGWFCEQISLLLAMNALPQKIRVVLLKERMNWSWRRVVMHKKDLIKFANLELVIVHYHQYIERDGLLYVGGLPKGEVRMVAHRYNDLVRAELIKANNNTS
jgi:hypothetical protein